jgi:hypothetical protein
MQKRMPAKRLLVMDLIVLITHLLLTKKTLAEAMTLLACSSPEKGVYQLAMFVKEPGSKYKDFMNRVNKRLEEAVSPVAERVCDEEKQAAGIPSEIYIGECFQEMSPDGFFMVYKV